MRSKFKNPARAAAVAVAALMGIGVGMVLGQTSFTDVQSDDPRSRDIIYVSNENWFRGYPDGSFRPDRPITEQQLARVIRRAHPGLTRGDAAVFLRGGMERLRAAGITPSTTTTAATTTTAIISETGGPGAGSGAGGPGTVPGAGGPVNTNPPVVNEGSTTTAVSDTVVTAPGPTTTIPRPTTTTTFPAPVGIGERNLVRYDYDTGWWDSEGQSGSLFWMEFEISGYRFPQDANLKNWWVNNGSVMMTISGTDSDGESASRTLVERGGGRITFIPFTIESVTVACGIRQGCADAERGLPDREHEDAVRWATMFGYTKPAPTTTTAAPSAEPKGRTLAYGKSDGWTHPRPTNPRRATVSIIWWEHRRWGTASLDVDLVMSYGGTIIVEADEPQPYSPLWSAAPFSIASVTCTASCTTWQTTMPDSIRDRLIADGFTAPSS